MKKLDAMTVTQKTVMTALRMLVGWLFLYEGLWKLAQGNWSAEGYLRTSQWLGSGMFHKIVENPGLLNVVNHLNIWGLTLIGVALILGVFVRVSSVCGILMLALYYIAQPPMTAPSAEGHYLIVDSGRIIVAAALLAVCLIPSCSIGALIVEWLGRKLRSRDVAADGGSGLGIRSVDRRDLLISLSSLPVLGVFGCAFLRKHSKERENLEAQPDAVTSATVKTFEFNDIKDLKKPNAFYGQIGSVKLSRMVLGGNLIGGWAHARDLIYTDKLVKAYHNDWRVFRTLKMAEECGVNAIITNPALMRVLGDYWKKEGGKIQFISDCGHPKGWLDEGARMSVGAGACAVYMHGGISDDWAKQKRAKDFEKTLNEMRKLNVPVGVGAHRLETIQFCVENGIVPDFWMKTFHDNNYWSARPQEGHDSRDNNWCIDPKAVVDFMANLEQPWIAFKTMAAGAIHPHHAFPFAFKGGADFICVGMYDFQLVEDVNFFTDFFPSVFPDCPERKRPWRGVVA